MFSISDIDECQNPKSCENGRCYNKEGTHVCLCDHGYKLLPGENVCIGEAIEFNIFNYKFF